MVEVSFKLQSDITAFCSKLLSSIKEVLMKEAIYENWVIMSYECEIICKLTSHYFLVPCNI